MRIAMWSGPRNLSTAMMYAFGNRSDFAVWDEPFYAAYLDQTGLDHPMRSEVLAMHEGDPQKIAAACAGPIPDGKPHFYMKHMTFHMLDGFPLDWADDCVHVHLLRHPARVVASYAEKRDKFSLADLGYEKQVDLFERFPGPVIDSFDVRADPDGVLRALCSEIGLGWDPAMLSWPVGGRAEDGVWAAHWYNAVHRSTGFAKPEGALPDLSGALLEMVHAALPHYRVLAEQKLRV